MFQAMLENATRICEAKFGDSVLCDGDGISRRRAARRASRIRRISRSAAAFGQARTPRLAASSATKQVVHIADHRGRAGYATAIRRVAASSSAAHRTLVVVPMLKDDELVGAIVIYRQEVRPFTDKQIELVQNFAAQAVIAIENTRLLNELRSARDLRCWSSRPRPPRCCKVISSSPGELEPVFEAMLENAARICEAKFGIMLLCEGDGFRIVATARRAAGTTPNTATARAVIRPAGQRRSAASCRPSRSVHIADVTASRIRRSPSVAGQARRRAHAARRADAQGRRADRRDRHLPPGGAAVHRQADRAGAELRRAGRHRHREHAAAQRAAPAHRRSRESLEQQTATAEVLKVISSSPGELEPVFDAMLENATRICEAKFGTMFRCTTATSFQSAAHARRAAGIRRVSAAARAGSSAPPGQLRSTASLQTKAVVHIADDARLTRASGDRRPGLAARVPTARRADAQG